MDPSKPPTGPSDVWGTLGALITLAALPWIISAGFSYFMLAWRTIP